VETYIVRLWKTAVSPEPEAGDEEARGIVRHVGSGREQPFTSWAELRTLLVPDSRSAPEPEQGR
jgi:hypothetical protein